jgi:hypothetical protein
MGWGSFSFHMGHLGRAHGRRVRLLAKVEGEKVSFWFVRNSGGMRRRWVGWGVRLRGWRWGG